MSTRLGRTRAHRHQDTARIIVGLIALLSPWQAEASTRPSENVSEGGGYLCASPGIVGLRLAEHRFAEGGLAFWPASLGGGMFLRWRSFKMTLGTGLEYRLFSFENAIVHGTHAVVETRAGGGNRRLWGYGLVGVSFGRTVVHWSDYHEDYAGVVPQLGVGVQATVVKRFFVGAELDVDFGYYFIGCADCETVQDFWYHTASLEFLMGWYF